jgi:DNA-binding transcriptional ArsR family regulator
MLFFLYDARSVFEGASHLQKHSRTSKKEVSMTEESNEILLNFFKALSDASRLQIVGLLAQRPHSVEEMAEALGKSVSTVSHHLQMLTHVGLVSARADGHYYIYSLDKDALRRMSQAILAENLPSPPQAEEGDAFERKVLSSFTDQEGRIISIPAQEKKFLVVLRYIVKAFEPGVRYTEKQVNEIIQRYTEDTATIRRSFIVYGFMDRQGGGGEYWRIDPDA